GARNVYVPGLAVSVHGGRVVLAVHGQDRQGAGLDVFTDGSGNGHVGLGLSLVDHVIFSDHINSDLSFRQIGIDTVATVGFSTGWVASRIFGLNLGVYVRISSQLSTRNIHVPSLAVSVNSGRVVLAVHG